MELRRKTARIEESTSTSVHIHCLEGCSLIPCHVSEIFQSNENVLWSHGPAESMFSIHISRQLLQGSVPGRHSKAWGESSTEGWNAYNC